MTNLRMKDVALVAVAGGLLAFELVSLGEVLPSAARALANRSLPKAARVATAEAAPTVAARATESVAPVMAAEPVSEPLAIVIEARPVGHATAHPAVKVRVASSAAKSEGSCEARRAEVRAALRAVASEVQAAAACPEAASASASASASVSGAEKKSCVVVTRARAARNAKSTVRVVSWTVDDAKAMKQLLSSRRELIELRKAIDLTVAEPTL